MVETSDSARQPVALTAGTTIAGQNQVSCHLTVVTEHGQKLEYFLSLNKPTKHTVWDITLDSSYIPRLTVDGVPGRTALPGVRLDRQFCWTLRGIP